MTFFRKIHHLGEERLFPLPDATSLWTGTHIRGPAITALLAGGAEGVLPAGSEWRPVRATFELHSQVPMEPCWAEARVLKQGRTLTLIESELFSGEGERPLARCRAAFVSDAVEVAAEVAVHHGESGGERAWSEPLPEECVPPAAEFRSVSIAGRLYRSASTEWTGSPTGHQNADRNVVWYFDDPIVEGEVPSSFQSVAKAADLGNHVINSGADGLAFINSDLTVHLSRPPTPGGVGVCGGYRSEHAGVAVGTAILFDALGACGTVGITAVRHAKTRIDQAG